MTERGTGRTRRADEERRRTCPACTHRNPPEAMFCESCATHLGSAMSHDDPEEGRCPACSAAKSPGAAFCVTCGKAVRPGNTCPICRDRVPPAITRCPSCKVVFAEVFAGSGFCWRCGGRVEETSFASTTTDLVLKGGIVISMGFAGANTAFSYFFPCFLLPVGIWFFIDWVTSYSRDPIRACSLCHTRQAESRRERSFTERVGAVFVLIYVLMMMLAYAAVSR